MEATYPLNSFLLKASQRRKLVFTVMAALVLLTMVISICSGSISYSVSEVWAALLNPGGQSDIDFIVWNIRLPRAIATVLGGAFLATSGLLLQVYFRNPIVGPFILGISSGATVMVSIVMLTTVGYGLTYFNPFLNTIAACLGAYGVMLLVVTLAGRVKNGVTLLIVGLMMGYLCHSVTSILTALAEKEDIKGFILWELGSFSGFKWIEIYVMLGFGGALLAGIYMLSKPLNAFLLGEDYAASMGVNIRRFRIMILLMASSLAGLVTSLAGPVAFIGLAVPHIARMSLGTADNRVLIPGVCLMGALVTSVCDLIARSWLAPIELPLSAITAFFGAPIVISLLLKKGMKA